MDAFISRKRPRLSTPETSRPNNGETGASDTEDSTDLKLAMLISLFPRTKQEELLDILVSCDGSVEAASSLLSSQGSAVLSPATKKRATSGSSLGVQTSLLSHVVTTTKNGVLKQENEIKKPPAIKKGKTLHLYAPEDIAASTPCTIIHNFLPAEEANALLVELLEESQHFSRYEFQLFNRTVQSPHTACVYVSTLEEYRQQTSEYTYGGTYRSNVRQATTELRSVSRKVQQTVNAEIQKRICEVYPGGKKLKYQSPKEWRPNAAFVNCYDGPAESVGFHSDELTYLGPHPVIGSLSLGVEREFRVRRVVAQDEDDKTDKDGKSILEQKDSPSKSRSREHHNASAARADAQGQISIHLPHNSLLVMHAEMQEEWKHAITPAPTISPHPVAGNRRINITYRWYRDTLHPRYTPRCRCGMHAILRCAQRKAESRGRYMWTCYASFTPGKQGCSFFQWAEFDDDGDPVWDQRRNDDEAPTLANFSASQ
ncbi:hypothetical protein NUU61_006100 [Penicillium alfredii]|uniref:Fe2OG dioxygenase domain-containing protein n=1 Tax=Penicillium alfredii TaxID=1506179 RepID=A0A9W9K3A8_9EURO|nr:uncharacterized protein NUU61_006100 [Penicillium alfredii]KAJ5091230.1 hypothetical protein NUU61_006100 [Penicillium alfredii]